MVIEEPVVFRAPSRFAMGERVRILRDMRAPLRTLRAAACHVSRRSRVRPIDVIAQQGAADPRAVLRLQARRRRRARPLSEDPRVLPAARQDDRSREVRGARQDDDGQLVCAAADQLAAEPGEVRSAVEINRRLADPRGLSDARGAEAGRRRQAVLPALRDDSLDRGLERPGDHHTSSIGWRPRTRRRSARFSTTRSCCWCRRRTPTASTS